MAALSAKKRYPQLRKYYEKKVAEGKNKMLVLSNARCKLIIRASAVIRRHSPSFVNTLKDVSWFLLPFYLVDKIECKAQSSLRILM